MRSGWVGKGGHTQHPPPPLLPPITCPPRPRPRPRPPPPPRPGELVPGSHVGTSSGRRRAQLLHAHPHLRVVALRGNVEARLAKIRARDMGATLMAAAGEAT